MAPVTKPKRNRERHFFREWREHLGLTQDEAAERIGATQSKLSRIEKGVTPYDQDFLEEAARAYGVSVDTLITRHPIIPTPPIRGEQEILYTLQRIEGLSKRGIELALLAITTALETNQKKSSEPAADDQLQPANPHHEPTP